MSEISKEAFVLYVAEKQAEANRTVASFKAKLEQDLDAIFSGGWINSLAKAAAWLAVTVKVMKALESPNSKATMKSITEYAVEVGLKSAQSTNRSTSNSADQYGCETTAVWATLALVLTGKEIY